jgi:uncharacterized protein YndB with AHSA1/START domain
MSTITKPRGENLVVERTYRAKPVDLWDLWTTKAGFESWWGPQGFRVEVHAIEPRVGGALRYDMIADAPEMIESLKRLGRPPSHPTTARFTEVKPHERLVITNVIDFIPGVERYESDIAVDLIVEGDHVRMVTTLEAMHSKEIGGMQLEGYTSQLSKLDDRFA